MGNAASTDKDGNPRSTLAKIIDPIGMCFQPTIIENTRTPKTDNSPPPDAGTEAELPPANGTATALEGAAVAKAGRSSSSSSDDVTGGDTVSRIVPVARENARGAANAARAGGVAVDDGIGKGADKGGDGITEGLVYSSAAATTPDADVGGTLGAGAIVS